MPPLAVVVLLGLAAMRVTRLFAVDTISEPVRARLYRWAWDEDNPREVTLYDGERVFVPSPRGRAWRTWFYDLVTCPWCLGVWVSIAVYCAWRWGGSVALAIIAVAAVAGVQGAVAQVVVAAEPDAVNKIAVVDDDRTPVPEDPQPPEES